MPEKTARTDLSHASRFLNARIVPAHNTADSEDCSPAVFQANRNRRVCAEEGFNRRVSISVQGHNVRTFNNVLAPKLSACVAGIESACYDFERFLLSQRLINLWLRLLFPKGSLWDFLGKKVSVSS